MKNLWMVGLFALLFSACETKDVFKLTGTLEGAEGKTIVISTYDQSGINTLDTLILNEGKINYETTLSEPLLILVGEAGKRGAANFFADNSAYTINGSVDSLLEATITGGTLYKEYKKSREADDQLREISGELRNQYVQAMQEGDADKADSIAAAYDAEVAKADSAKIEIVKTNASNALAAFLVNEIYGHKELDQMLEGKALLAEGAIKSVYYKALIERIEKLQSVAVGQEAPDFTLNDVEGNPLALSSLKGKVLLVDFWASWCGPCRGENPNVVKIYADYKDKGFDILGVSLDNKKDAWLKAIADDHLTWHHVSDLQGWKSAAAQLYAVNSIPHTVLIGKDGKIIANNLRGEELRAKIAELLD